MFFDVARVFANKALGNGAIDNAKGDSSIKLLKRLLFYKKSLRQYVLPTENLEWESLLEARDALQSHNKYIAI